MRGILVTGERAALNRTSGKAAALDLLAPLRERPDRSAVVCDIDGTLAPIVSEPDSAVVPAETRDLLTKLSRRYRLVACISGRRAEDARRVVGIGSLAYVGNHGLEQLAPGGVQAQALAGGAEYQHEVRVFAETQYTPALRTAGVRLEDKGPIWSFHWRDASDERSAREAIEVIARAAEERGLVAHWGRKVLEVRPPVPLDKGTAITAILERAGVRAALYGGDDATDVDAFRALQGLRAGGRLDHVVCVGVASDEAPPAVIDEADLVVDGPAGFHELLAALAAG
jgi:trehalose 6-phosphate phosphatase